MRLDEAARTFLGVPFKHQGRDRAIGIDCIGLLVLSAAKCGLPQAAMDSTDYGRDPFAGLLEFHLLAAFGEPLAVSEAQPGDVVSIDFKGAVRHAGIVGDHPAGLSLIHTNYFVGRVTEARIDPKWLKRIRGVYRVG